MQLTQEEQLRFAELETGQESLPKSGTKAGFNDPAFTANKSLPIHRWVPWIAGFSSAFVADAIQRTLSSPGTVLDPFCGVGTTLLEAAHLGHKAIGFEINQYAAFASQAKLGAYDVSATDLLNRIAAFEAFYRERISSDYSPESKPPVGFNTRAPFFSPAVLHKVLTVLDFTSTIEHSEIGRLFQLAFAATMVTYSNYSYEPSLGRRASAGKADVKDYPVGETIASKLKEMATDVVWLQNQSDTHSRESRVIRDSFFHYEEYLSADSIDLVITSPPYLNNYHYSRNTRPQLYWLEFAHSPQDLKLLEESNFGKYWQTVRDKQAVALEFSLHGSDLAARLDALRSLNGEKGIYGGNGWANYAASYFNDCRRFLQGINYALSPGSTALVVIGNSILQGVMIPTDKYLAEIAESVGLELARIDIPRATRVGNSIIQSQVRVGKAHDSHQLYESVVELRKPISTKNR